MRLVPKILRGAVLATALAPAVATVAPSALAMQMQRSSTTIPGTVAPEALVGTWAYGTAACTDPSALRLHPDGRVESHGLRGFWQLDDERIVVFVRKPPETGDHARVQRRASFRTEWHIREFEANRMILGLDNGDREFVRC